MRTLRYRLAIAALAFALVLSLGGGSVPQPTAQAQTTNVTFTVPTAMIPDLVAGFDARFARLPAELPANAANNASFAKRCTREYWKSIVNTYRADQAAAGTTRVVGDDFGND